MNAITVYYWAYSVLENLTPVLADCGKLCNAACCKDTINDGSEAGMCIFITVKRLCSKTMTE